MPKYLLAQNSNDDSLAYTGIVSPKTGWAEAEDGRRTRTDIQEVDENGVPLWLVSTTRLTESYGRQSETVADVLVQSLSKPRAQRHHPAEFIGLSVEVRVNKSTGQLIENFTALGLNE